MLENVPVENENFDEVQREIRKTLTHFAASYVCTEYKKSKSMKIAIVENGFYVFRNRSAVTKVTENSCSCGFYSSMTLLCCHIMAVSREKNLPIYVTLT